MQDLLKSFVNEVSRVPIGHEGFSKVSYFLIEMLGVRDSNCFGDQSFEDIKFLRRVVKIIKHVNVDNNKNNTSHNSKPPTEA